MLCLNLHPRVLVQVSQRRVGVGQTFPTCSVPALLLSPSHHPVPQRCFGSGPGEEWDVQQEPEFQPQDQIRQQSSRPRQAPKFPQKKPRPPDTQNFFRDHPLLQQDPIHQSLSEASETRRREKSGDVRRQRLRNLGEVHARERLEREQQIVAHNLRRNAELTAKQDIEETLFGDEAKVFDPKKDARPIRPEPGRKFNVSATGKFDKSASEHESGSTASGHKASRGPIVDKEGQMLEPRNWIQSIRRATDPQEFKHLVRLARYCNWVGEGGLMGSALMQALKSRFPFGVVHFTLRGKEIPSEIVLTNACSVAIEHGYGSDMLELLVGMGAILDGPTDIHPLPLHQALISQREGICVWLMKRGVRTDLNCPITLRNTVEVALMSDMGDFLRHFQLELPDRVVHSRSILWALVKKNFSSSVKVLMERGADVAQPDDLGEVPLVLAASLDHWEVIQVLTEGGVSIFDPFSAEEEESQGGGKNSPAQQNYVPANQVSPQPRYSTAFATAVRLGRHRTVRGLLALGADLNARHPITGATPLMEAVENGEVKLVDQLLSMGADPYVWDSEHRNAMSIAVAENQILVLRCLLQHKLDLNTADPVYAVTPLMLAALHNRLDMIQLLLQYQADPHRVSKNGQTAVGTALRTKRLNLVQVLVESGANVDTRDESGRTILYHAIERGDLQLVRFILERDPSFQISLLEPELDPVTLAVRLKQDESVDLLIQAGYLQPQAVRMEDTEKEDSGEAGSGKVSWRKTWALAEAARLENMTMCAVLMRSGADPVIPDPTGNSPLHYAVQHEQPNMDFIRALFRRGANPFAQNADGLSAWHLCPDPDLQENLVLWNSDRPAAMQAMLPDELL